MNKINNFGNTNSQNQEVSIKYLGGIDSKVEKVNLTGSSTLLKFPYNGGELKIIVDLGMFQGSINENKYNEEISKELIDADYLFLTHAHMDHIGKVPALVKAGFKGRIVTTKLTGKIVKHMWEDYVKLTKNKIKDINYYNKKVVAEASDMVNYVGQYQKYLNDKNIKKNQNITYKFLFKIARKEIIGFLEEYKEILKENNIENLNEFLDIEFKDLDKKNLEKLLKKVNKKFSNFLEENDIKEIKDCEKLKKEVPKLLYDENDIFKTLRLVESHGYHKNISISPNLEIQNFNKDELDYIMDRVIKADKRSIDIIAGTRQEAINYYTGELKKIAKKNNKNKSLRRQLFELNETDIFLKLHKISSEEDIQNKFGKLEKSPYSQEELEKINQRIDKNSEYIKGFYLSAIEKLKKEDIEKLKKEKIRTIFDFKKYIKNGIIETEIYKIYLENKEIFDENFKNKFSMRQLSHKNLLEKNKINSFEKIINFKSNYQKNYKLAEENKLKNELGKALKRKGKFEKSLKIKGIDTEGLSRRKIKEMRQNDISFPYGYEDIEVFANKINLPNLKNTNRHYLNFTFFDAGHIEGSSQLLINYGENQYGNDSKIQENLFNKNMLFSGDLGKATQPNLSGSFETPGEKLDFVQVESTYALREHPDKIKEEARFIDIIKHSRGDVLIPAFSLQRMQEIAVFLTMYYGKNRQKNIKIAKLQEENSNTKKSIEAISKIKSLTKEEQLKLQNFKNEYARKQETIHELKLASQENVEIYFDSSLGFNIMKHFIEYNPKLYGILDPEVQKKKFGKVICKIVKPGETGHINHTEAKDKRVKKIFITSGGMLQGGTSLTYLPYFIDNPETNIVLAGYQSEGTLGRQLLDSPEKINLYGKEIDLLANVHSIGGFSSHAGNTDLIENYIGKLKLGVNAIVSANHGDERREEFASNIQELVDNTKELVNVIAPELNQEIYL